MTKFDHSTPPTIGRVPGIGAQPVPGAGLPELPPDDYEPPYCDFGCGDHATVRFLDVGLCDDHAEEQVREALKPLLGEICANVSRRKNGFLTVCLAPYGIEHDHD